MLKMSYGQYYLENPTPNLTLNKSWSVKQLKDKRWLVYEIHSGNMFEIFPTKLRAYYAASKLNGKVTDVFHFGTEMFK